MVKSRSRFSVLLFLFGSLAAGAQSIHYDYPSYYATFEPELQCTRQVEYVLHTNDVREKNRRSSWRFQTDDFPPGMMATHDDYTNTGYHRGHLCPAADRNCSRSFMKTTFRISNIAPQVPALNLGTWKATENFVRSLVPMYDSVRVIVLPVWLHRDTTFIGISKIAVPHAFIKAVFTASNDSLISQWFYWNK